MKKFKRIIHKKLGNFGFNLIDASMNNKNKISISLLTKLKLLPEYDIMICATIDKRRIVTINSKLLKDGFEYQVNNKESIGLIQQFINNISLSFNKGSINLHP